MKSAAATGPSPDARKIRALLRSNLLYNRYLPVNLSLPHCRRAPSA